MKLEIKRSVLRSVGRKEREREKKRTKQKYRGEHAVRALHGRGGQRKQYAPHLGAHREAALAHGRRGSLAPERFGRLSKRNLRDIGQLRNVLRLRLPQPRVMDLAAVNDESPCAIDRYRCSATRRLCSSDVCVNYFCNLAVWRAKRRDAFSSPRSNSVPRVFGNQDTRLDEPLEAPVRRKSRRRRR